MMATVTTPAGDVMEGVTGSLLDYYRAEGYEVADDESEAVEFPQVHGDVTAGQPNVAQAPEVTQPEPPAGQEVDADPVPDSVGRDRR